MVLPQHHHHKSDQLSPSSSCCESNDFDGGSDIGGPMFCNTSNQVAVASCNMGNIYDVVSAASGAVMVSNPIHAYISTDPSFTFNSSGGMATPVNFTASQWQELQRQTLICKYMMASVPVPHELLIPITKTLSNTTPSHHNAVKSSLALGISSNNSDPEPLRCKRTDGKKWRCSRDVALDQKYCDRHSHKSRLRSRKLVELPAHFTNTNNKTHETHTSLYFASHTSRPYQNPQFICQSDAHFPINPTLPSATSVYDQPRCLDWFMKGETVSVASNSNQEWPQMVHPQVGLRRDGTKCGDNEQYQRDQHFTLQSQRESEQSSLVLSPRLASLEGSLHLNQNTQTHETRHFIDAWSKAEKDVTNIDEIGNNCSVSSKEKVPLSSLSLSMYGGSETNEEQENGEMGTYVIMGTERENNVGAMRPQWMNSGSWMGSPPGGPLAEALCLGVASSAKGTSNSTSPRGCSISSTTTNSGSKNSS